MSSKAPFLFRHIIDLVDFFEGVSESVIVMEFAEGWAAIMLAILSFLFELLPLQYPDLKLIFKLNVDPHPMFV